MLVREQMILTVFKIALALRAEPELQCGVIQLRTSANGAFMFGHTIVCLRMQRASHPMML